MSKENTNDEFNRFIKKQPKIITFYIAGINGPVYRDIHDMDEKKLYDFICNHNNDVVFIKPWHSGVFREKFIAPLLDDKGYIKQEGIYGTHLCGDRIIYRIIKHYDVFFYCKEEEAWKQLFIGASDKQQSPAITPLFSESALNIMLEGLGFMDGAEEFAKKHPNVRLIPKKDLNNKR